MEIGVSQLYIDGSLPFSQDMQELLSKELSAIVEASPAYASKYASDHVVTISVGTRRGTTECVVAGPAVYKNYKFVEFSILIPFDTVLNADHGPRCALRFLFDGIRTVLARYEIDATKLTANESRIIDEIVSNPEMFKANRPWPTLANYKPPAPPPPEDPSRPAFKRVYKRINGVLHYESVFAHEGIAHHHTGKVGQKAKTKELPYASVSPQKAVDTFLGVALAKGFTELPENHEIEIQYAINGMGTPDDFDKLDALEEQLHDLLGTLGLGVCDENSIGSDTMEVSCFVVDADIAIKCIKKHLKGTRFGDYASIHVVDHDEEDDDA